MMKALMLAAIASLSLFVARQSIIINALEMSADGRTKSMMYIIDSSKSARTSLKDCRIVKERLAKQMWLLDDDKGRRKKYELIVKQIKIRNEKYGIGGESNETKGPLQTGVGQ